MEGSAATKDTNVKVDSNAQQEGEKKDTDNKNSPGLLQGSSNIRTLIISSKCTHTCCYIQHKMMQINSKVKRFTG